MSHPAPGDPADEPVPGPPPAEPSVFAGPPLVVTGPPHVVTSQPSVFAGPPPAASPRRPRGRYLAAALALAAVGCLAVAAATGAAAHSALTSKPTAAERKAAAAAAVSGRWRSWPAGKIFPAGLGYGTDLLTSETASRIGISAEDGCGAAVEASFGRLAVRDRCLAGLRATYLDQLDGIVYTIGVLAFPDARHAAAFAAGLSAGGAHLIALRALALPGTASARFSDAARQAATARDEGPFVVLTAAGYADGRPAAVTGEHRNSIFAPAAQLGLEVISQLNAPPVVNCSSPDFSC